MTVKEARKIVVESDKNNNIKSLDFVEEDESGVEFWGTYKLPHMTPWGKRSNFSVLVTPEGEIEALPL